MMRRVFIEPLRSEEFKNFPMHRVLILKNLAIFHAMFDSEQAKYHWKLYDMTLGLYECKQ